MVNKTEYWPHWNLERIHGQYDVVSLMHSFVNLARYDTTFKKSNATIHNLVGKEAEYSKTLLMFAIFALMTGTFFLILLVIGTCVRCCCFSKSHNNGFSGISRKRLLNIIFLFVFVAIGLFAHGIGFAGRQRLSSGIKDTCETISYAYNNVSQSFDTIENIKNNAEKIEEKVLKEIKTNMDEINRLYEKISAQLPYSIRENLNEFNHYFGQINSEIDKTKGFIHDMSLDGFKSVLKDMQTVNDHCLDVKNKFQSSALSSGIVFTIFTVLFLCALFNNCLLRCICSFFGWLQLIIFLLCISALLPFLVGTGDFCLNVRTIIDKNRPDEPILKYYLDCPEPGSEHDALKIRKIIDDINRISDDAEKHMKEYDQKIEDVLINEQLKCNEKQNFNELEEFCGKIQNLRKTIGLNSNDNDDTLKSFIFRIKEDAKILIEKVDCKKISPYLYTNLTNLCTNFYLALFYYGMNFTIAFFAVWMIVILTVCLC